MAPKDLWGEKPAPCHGWTQNLGQLLGTNGSQAPSKIKHYQRGVGVDIYLDDKATASFAWSTNDLDTATADTTFRIDMFPAGPKAQTPSIHEFNQFPGLANYYKGALPSEVEGVKSFGDIVWHNAFTNVDLSWSSNKVGPKLYVTLYPGADPDSVIFKFLGADSLHLDWQGALKAYLAEKWIELREAFAYQIIGTDVVPVPWTADWELLMQGNTARLIFGTYDPEYPLVLLFGVPESMAGGGPQDLEPANMMWSTYVGGNLPDELEAVDVDADGHPYVCGYAWDNNFPVGIGTQVFPPSQPDFLGSEDMVIMKFNKVNKQVVWATYHGGSNISIGFSGGGRDRAQDIAVYKGPDSDLRFAFITGITYCEDFPVGRHFNQPHPFAASAYVHANNPRNERAIIAAYKQENGLLCWSTTHGVNFSGYSEEGVAIDVDEDGTLAVGGLLRAGTEETIPNYQYVTPSGAFTKGNGGGVFMVFNPSYQILWCSPFGTRGGTGLADVMISQRGIWPYNKVLYLAGSAVTAGPGSGPWGTLDVTPSSLSSSYYQAAAIGFGPSDGYWARLDIESNYQLDYCTYWGGAGLDRTTSLAQSLRPDGGWDIYMSGGTNSTDLGDYPAMDRLPNPGNGELHRSELSGMSDGYVIRLDDQTDQLTWGTLVGGGEGDGLVKVAIAPGDQVLLTGHTRSPSDVNTAPNNGLFSQTVMGNDPDSQHNDAFFMLLNRYLYPVWSSYIGGTKTDRSWGIAASEEELYVVGGTNSNQFTFPLKEFDENSNLDYYDGNHLNNANGTHGFAGGFMTGGADPLSTEPDGFICAFAITTNVGIDEALVTMPSVQAVHLGTGLWLIPHDASDQRKVVVEVFDARGRVVPCSRQIRGDGVLIDLGVHSAGLYVAKVSDGRTQTSAKLMHR